MEEEKKEPDVQVSNKFTGEKEGTAEQKSRIYLGRKTEMMNLSRSHIFFSRFSTAVWSPCYQHVYHRTRVVFRTHLSNVKCTVY